MNKYSLLVIKSKKDIQQISYFFLAMIFLFVILKDNLWIHYDNFSHWGIVAKEIVTYNRFPNFQSELIQFQSYATGSASFIYYISKIAGIHSEGFMSVAQSWLVLSACFTFFAWISPDLKKYSVPTIIFSLLLFIVNIQPYDLLVDTLLTSLALATVNIIVFYKKSLQQVTYLLGLIFLFLISVKTSGIFFVISALFLMILYSFKMSKELRFKIWLQTLYVSLGTVFLNLLWKAHVAYVFVEGNKSKHSFSLSSYKENLLDKGKSKIIEIVSQYFQRIFSFDNIILLLFVLIGGILIYYIWNKRKLLGMELIAFSVLVYVIYHINLLAMYLVSMPYDEAKNLDSFSRYDLTIVLFVLGVLLIYLLKYATQISNRFLYFSTILLIIFSLIHRASFYQFITSKFTAERYEIEEKLKDIPHQNHVPTVIRINKKSVSKGYLWYLFRYDLQTKDISINYPDENNLGNTGDIQSIVIEY
ncbi:hypothetical protein [Streptococcus oralis]|nr:hypothetical protein [Streptococcus oralis]